MEILQKVQKDLKDKNIEPESLKMESSSSQCSVTSIGQREEIQKDVFKIPNKARFTRSDSRGDTGHSSARERSGTELSAAHLKENGIPSPHKW